MKSQQILTVFVAALFLWVSGVCAQELPLNDSQPAAPISPLPLEQINDSGARQMPAPAARGVYVLQDFDSTPIQPDNHALSGAETIGLGSLGNPRVTFDSALRFAESIETDMTFGSRNWATSLGGSLEFDRHWRRYRLAAFYSGAQTFYRPNSSYSPSYHNVAVSQVIQWNRWTLRVRDDISVSPEAGFGSLYTDLAGLSAQSSTLTNLSPSFMPSETILTGRSNRLNNTAVGEIDYAVSRRTVLTFAGAYGLLHFPDAGFFDSRDVSARVGYNYALDPRNSVAVLYDYDNTRFRGMGNRIETHLAQIGFARQVTGRLAFQVSAGPQWFRLRNFGPSSGDDWEWGLTNALTYRISRATGTRLYYFHGITSGSGVFVGAKTDSVTASIAHDVTRLWSVSVHGGFARNRNLARSTTTSNQYENGYGGASVGRQVGRQIRLGLSYRFQRQTSVAGGCPVLSCGLPGGSRHFTGITLEWHPWAIQPR